MFMFGIFGGKPRSKLGKWLDKYGITQEWLMQKSGLGRNTVSRACSNEEYEPTSKTIKKIMKAVREVDPHKKAEDFFDM